MTQGQLFLTLLATAALSIAGAREIVRGASCRRWLSFLPPQTVNAPVTAATTIAVADVRNAGSVRNAIAVARDFVRLGSDGCALDAHLIDQLSDLWY